MSRRRTFGGRGSSVGAGSGVAGAFPWGRGGGVRAVVSAVAAVCALALAGGGFVAPPGGDSREAPAPYDRRGPAQVRAEQASLRSTGAASCDEDHPETSLSPSSASGPAVERIKRRGKLVVGVDQNSYRWGYRDPATGDIVGFDIDLVKAIAKNLLGDENAVIYRTVPTSKRFEAVHDRDVDMVVRTVTISCARITDKQYPVLFSAAYFRAGQQLLVPKRYSKITGYNTSLRGRKVCTAKKSTGLDKLTKDRARLGMDILTVDNQLDCLVRLQLGQVDAVFTDNALAAGQAAQDPTVRLIGSPVTEEYYGVAMNPEDTDLVRRVNLVLQQYTAGGRNSDWMRAYRTWLETVLPGITAPPGPRYSG